MPGYKVNSKRGLFDYQMSKQPLKNVVSMLIKDKDITSYQLLLTKQDRVLVLASLTSFFDYTVVNLFFFFTFRKKWVGRAMGNETFYLDGLIAWGISSEFEPKYFLLMT